MDVLLLGPVELRAAGRPVPLGGPRQRSVLAALATDAGTPVPVDVLLDRVWGESPPPRARHALHAYIARLRRIPPLGPAQLVRRSGGYALEIDPRGVDICRFRRLVDQARDRECPDRRRVTLLDDALGLWRGPPLADLDGEWAVRTRESWRQQYVDAALTWARACLRLDDPEPVLDRLTGLVDEHPTLEPLTAVLMRALHATGRTAEALDHYDRIRRLLRAELGVEPGTELQHLHQRMVTVETAPPTGAPAPPAPPVPRQLPAPPGMFIGRATELAQLDRIGNAGGSAVITISGMAGVGKTTLALHWAHRAADRFPDGQLYVNLRGFGGGPPTEPAAAVRRFLDALGVPPQRVPADFDAQVALYRSLLAGRRMLVLLDNARDADQVRPLLPGAPGCLTVVTSRDRFTGLVATDGAQPLGLDILSPTEARELLARRLGADRIAAEPDAADEIVTHCARLPLALAITAARAATYPTLPLSALAAQLRDAQGRLDALDTGDAAADVRAVFSWSYRQVSPASARLFRLLGLHPGPDISAAAATSLAGAPARTVATQLAELTRVQLLTEPTYRRYACHDLLRVYAATLAEHEESTAERSAAVRRGLDHYLHTAYRAARLRHPTRQRFVPAEPAAGVVPEPLADAAEALAWFTTEHQVLLAAVPHAAASGHDRHAYQLAWCLTDYLDWRGHWHDWASVQRIAIEAAERMGDPVAQVLALRGMAGSQVRRGDYDSAYALLARALVLLDGPATARERAEVHLNLSVVRGRQGRFAEALRHAERCLELWRATGDEAGEGHALEAVAWAHLLLGNPEQALRHGRRSLAHARRRGNREAEAASWETLGRAHLELGEHAEALTCHQNALALCRALGNRYFEARALDHLGDTYDRKGSPLTARQHWAEALAILDELGHPEAAQLRGKLRDAE